MANRGNPFTSAEDWRSLVIDHSAPILPTQVWDRHWSLHGRKFIPLIQVTECSLDDHHPAMIPGMDNGSSAHLSRFSPDKTRRLRRGLGTHAIGLEI